MSDLARQMEKLRGSIHPDWSEERARTNERAFLRKKRQRPVKRAAAATALVALVALSGLYLTRTRGGVAPARMAEVVRGEDGSLAFADGSKARLLDDSSEMRAEASKERVLVALVRGGARFDVVHRPERLFRIEAGPIAIEDRGTRFTVERLPAAVRVRVEEGEVAVFDPKGETALTAGHEGLFAFPKDAPAPKPSVARPAKRGWKVLAKDGDYDAAWKELGPGGMGGLKDKPEDLLLAADVARLSRHPEQALAPLKTLIERHRADPRSSLAAFTLGRVLLEELGRPREAAHAFAETQKLAPKGPLAEDALAREVEAWSRAGEASMAREKAEQYQASYPAGLRLRTVRIHGGLE